MPSEVMRAESVRAESVRAEPVRAEAARPVPGAGAPRVLVVTGSVGAGHDGAARELAARLAAAGAAATVRDFLDAVPRPVAHLLREGYIGAVGRVPLAFELLFRRLEHRGLAWRAEQAICRWAEPTVLRWVAEERPDVVVATYPVAAQTLGRLRRDGRLAAPALTYLTDPAVHVSWLHPGVDRHLAVTRATAAHGAAAYGAELETAGPLVPARFAVPPRPEETRALRRELAVDADRPLALLVAGSLGLGDLTTTVDDVAAAGFTALVLCGRNEALRRTLRGRPGTVALGWRGDVDRLMHTADVLVQNAGGLSFTESLVAGLPAVTYRPIPGHGRANARVLHAAGLAPWARSRAELAACLRAQAARGRVHRRFPDPVDAVLAACAAPVRAAA
jgi:UDP-N-acetylglucosamine:LPS N-acetylglucosamine transferase